MFAKQDATQTPSQIPFSAMRFSGHDHHLRYHHYQQEAYGPFRIQDYIQPSQAFYGYNQSYQQQFAYNSSQNYINSYNRPHRVPIPSEFAHTAGPGYTHLRNRQGPFQIGSVENRQHSDVGRGSTVADKMNPVAVSAAAAVAAPSQLTQIARNMDVAQRATNSLIGQSLYIGSGDRVDIPFRGARWAQFNRSVPPLYHGRGRGRGGGGRQIPPHSSRPTNSEVAFATATAGANSVVQSAQSVPGKKLLPPPATAGATHTCRPTNSQVASAPAAAAAPSAVQSAPSVPGKKPLPAPVTTGATHTSRPTNSQVASAPATAGATSVVQSAPSFSRPKPLPTLVKVPSAPLQPLPQNSWCEICKVHCGVPAKLEEHKNGKRHKRKLSAQEKLKMLKAADGQQSEQMPTSQLTSAIPPEKIQELEKEGCLTENIISQATVDNQQGGIELQKETGKFLELPAEEQIGGRGGKCMKSDDGSRRPVEFPQPTQAPLICEFCNVKCDSKSILDDHIRGKRHKKNLKRASRGLHALYPPDANDLANLIDFLVEREISNPQILSAQLVIRSALSQPQKLAISSPSGPLATQVQVATSVAGSGSEPECQNVLQTEVLETLARVKNENSAGETNCI